MRRRPGSLAVASLPECCLREPDLLFVLRCGGQAASTSAEGELERPLLGGSVLPPRGDPVRSPLDPDRPPLGDSVRLPLMPATSQARARAPAVLTSFLPWDIKLVTLSASSKVAWLALGRPQHAAPWPTHVPRVASHRPPAWLMRATCHTWLQNRARRPQPGARATHGKPRARHPARHICATRGMQAARPPPPPGSCATRGTHALPGVCRLRGRHQAADPQGRPVPARPGAPGLQVRRGGDHVLLPGHSQRQGTRVHDG